MRIAGAACRSLVYFLQAVYIQTMKQQPIFTTCPRCNTDTIRYDGMKKYSCASCGFVYYHNPAAAVGCIIQVNNRLLVLRRANEPGRGKYDVPGGFVDPGESAEDALRRELREEIGIEADELSFFASFSNLYEYKGIVYPTCDIYFKTKISSMPEKFDPEEVNEILFIPASDIGNYEFAFPSVHQAVMKWSSIVRSGRDIS